MRKLLLYICGSKDKYRALRDLHALETHMKQVQSMCARAGLDPSGSAGGVSGTLGGPVSIPYDSLIALIEHLKQCSEIATNRTINWQRFCQREVSYSTGQDIFGGF